MSKSQREKRLRRELAEIDYRISHDKLIQRCREDVSTFIEYVFGIKMHPFHRMIQNLPQEHKHLSLDAPVEHGKTFNMSVCRPLWLLGNNPHHTLAIVSNSLDHPIQCLAVIRDHIENNERLHEVFPTLKLKQDTRTQITVERGVTVDRDPSILGIGINGTIIGRRWSGLILDDILDFDNTWTHEQRVKLFRVIESTLLNRVLKNGFIIDIGTPWHVEDARHRMRNQYKFAHYRFDATDGLWPELYVDPQTGKEYGFPVERLEEKRRTMSVMEFDRQYRCIASSGSLAIFHPETVESCLKFGRGLRLGRPAPNDAVVVSGVDLAIKKQDTADKTVITTGTLDDGKKEILDIRAGQWELQDICQEIIATVRRYPSHYGFRVESNAAQMYLVHALQNRDIMRAMGATDRELERIRIYPHFTTGKKYDPVQGIRSLAVDFEQERFVLPCDDDCTPWPEVHELMTGLTAFDPMAHTSDYVMSMWLFSEQIRRFWVPQGGGFSDLGVW